MFLSVVTCHCDCTQGTAQYDLVIVGHSLGAGVVNILIPCHCDCTQGTAQYDLAIVGHSLGAGVAAILAVLLHRLYPALHCYAYSPPGCLMRYSVPTTLWQDRNIVYYY